MKIRIFSSALLLAATVSAPALAKDVQAGPIWSNDDAAMKCPAAAAAVHGTWNGNWTTTVPSRMSVCGVDDINPQDVQAGPIWSNEDANVKCPVAAAAVNGAWNGQWTTTEEGKMSVCGVLF